MINKTVFKVDDVYMPSLDSEATKVPPPPGNKKQNYNLSKKFNTNITFLISSSFFFVM